jgi:hypothetical protein
MATELGKFLLIAGGILAAIGLVLVLTRGNLGFLGRLPGDLSWEKGNVRIYVPLATSLLVSVVLTILVRLFRR